VIRKGRLRWFGRVKPDDTDGFKRLCKDTGRKKHIYETTRKT